MKPRQELDPPTEDELVGPPPHSLDEKCVLRNFLGKTQEEVVEVFPRNPDTEDFTYMAAAGLCYYLPAALIYLESEASTGDWEFAHGLMCALSTQVGIFGMRGEPLGLIKRVAEYCNCHRDKFDITAEDLFDQYLQTIRTVE